MERHNFIIRTNNKQRFYFLYCHISPSFSLFFLHSAFGLFGVFIFHTSDLFIRSARKDRTLFLLVIFVHMLDTDSVCTPAAFALIELFLKCPPNKLAVRSYNVRARRWDSTKQSYSRHCFEPRNIRREKTIYWSEARAHIFQSESKHDRFISRKLNFIIVSWNFQHRILSCSFLYKEDDKHKSNDLLLFK